MNIKLAIGQVAASLALLTSAVQPVAAQEALSIAGTPPDDIELPPTAWLDWGPQLVPIAATSTSYFQDGGPPTFDPEDLAVDGSGNVYVADRRNRRVRMIDASGTVTTLAGNGEDTLACVGEDGYWWSDGGSAEAACLGNPRGVGADTAGNVFVAAVNRILKIDASGTISTLALAGYKNTAGGMAVDAVGNVYVVGTQDRAVYKIDASGTVTTFAGTGEEGSGGDGGPATQAQFAAPTGVAVDVVGNVYVADSGNNRVRRIDPSGTITTLAGTGEEGFRGDGGPATEAQFDGPTGVAVDSLGNVYVADSGNGRVRKIDASGTITTLVGGPGRWDARIAQYWSAESTSDQPSELRAVAVGGNGAVYVASSDAVYLVGHPRPPTGVTPAAGEMTGEVNLPEGTAWVQRPLIEILAGTEAEGFAGDGGPARMASFSDPRGVATDGVGNVYVADTGNHRVRRIDKLTGKITTLAGKGENGFAGDGGQAQQAQFNSPTDVAVDAAGNVYVADSGNRRVRKIDPSGTITTFAGTGTWDDFEYGSSYQGGDGGPATSAEFYYPHSLAIDPSGNIYVSDYASSRIRKISAHGEITTLAGSGSIGVHYSESTNPTPSNSSAYGYGGDGGPADQSMLYSPVGVAADRSGNLYIADTLNHRVRRVDSSGTITTFVGTGDSGFVGDDGPAAQARLHGPVDVAVDNFDNVYVSDWENRRVRKIDSSETITTYLRDFQVKALALDTHGQLYGVSGNRLLAVRPRMVGKITVRLGSSTESVEYYVSTDGTVWLSGRPVLNGHRVMAENGNIYELSNRSGGVVASYVPRRQTLELPAGGRITLSKQEDETWRSGIAVAKTGPDGSGILRVYRGGREYVLDLYRDAWSLPPYTLRTVAGTAEVAEDVPAATQASLSSPLGVAVDSLGNVYVADTGNHRVRKINRAGRITTLAGTGYPGSGGDGGLAVQAQLQSPQGVAVDSLGNVYVADTGNHRVRKINRFGRITTLAGTGDAGFRGDGGSAALAQLKSPRGVAVDSLGNVYVADAWNVRVRKIAGSGQISTVYFGIYPVEAVAVDQAGRLRVCVGSSTFWDSESIDEGTYDGPLAAGGGREYDRWSLMSGVDTLAYPCSSGIAVDSAGDTYYSRYVTTWLRSQGRKHAVWKEDWHELHAGSPHLIGYSRVAVLGGPDREEFPGRNGPAGVAVDADGNLYVADPGKNRILRIDTSGTSTTFAGGRELDTAAVTASDAKFTSLKGLALDRNGSIVFTDGNRIRKLDVGGMVSVIAGTGESGFGGDGGPAVDATFDSPSAVATDIAGNVYVADTGNGVVRKIDESGVITTLPGKEEFYTPTGVTVDVAGNVYVADGLSVRKIDLSGQITTVVDGDDLNNPTAVVADEDGNVYVTSTPWCWVGLIAPDGTFDILIGLPGERVPDIALDESGDLVLARSTYLVRLETPPWRGYQVKTIARSHPKSSFSYDSVAPIWARLSVHGLDVDQSGMVWFTDPEAGVIRVLEKNPY